jgi:hypothetical protein
LLSLRLSDPVTRARFFLFWNLFFERRSRLPTRKTNNEKTLKSKSHKPFPPLGLAGTLAGAGGGACQTVVMAPMTFLVTAAVTSQPGSDSG